MGNWRQGDPERRKMSEDGISRDRLLERLDANVTFLVENQKNITRALVDHAHNDDLKFEKVDKSFAWVNKIIYGGIGIIVFVEFYVKVFK